MRCDKYRIALMEKILRSYNSSKVINDNNLSINLFLRSRDELLALAKKIVEKINNRIKKIYNIEISKSLVEAGSGSLPTEKIESIAISFTSSKISTNKISNKLRSADTPIFNYINNDKVYVDLKAIPNDQVDILIKQINKCL